MNEIDEGFLQAMWEDLARQFERRHDLRTGVLEEIARKRAERIELEIAAAWRAGYDYIYVGTNMRHDVSSEMPSTYEIDTEMMFVPSNHDDIPVPRGFVWELYDAHKLDKEKFEELMA